EDVRAVVGEGGREIGRGVRIGLGHGRDGRRAGGGRKGVVGSAYETAVARRRSTPAKRLSRNQPGNAWTRSRRPSIRIPPERIASANVTAPIQTRASTPASADTTRSTSNIGSFTHTSEPRRSRMSQQFR